MKRLITGLVIIIFFSAFAVNDTGIYKDVEHNSFAKGELLQFKVTFGIFTVGKGQMKIHNTSYKINNRNCLRVDVQGKTTGAVSWVAKVDDNWGAYIDSAALVPHISYRKIKENKYRKDELIKFDHATDMIEAKVADKKTGLYKEPEYYKAPDNIFDMIGGYMYLRTIDFNKHNIGDTLTIDAFFEDTVYDFRIMYQGKEVVNTKIGKMNAIKLVPIMPDNKLFDGENSISVWFSDDENRIPLRIEADMFIGTAGIYIIHQEGLLHELNYYKK
ncbi:DUF3108 domain-containing protein [Fulvivirgaceae bacterium BMA10]|uniref:DUF3108 domain-containing protein n=1 Tax=Splendidivirga corallicola TaxID=3051826 RepID=A0ABT8KWV3_9BACT|nr:DUF3108 domain-containing protein [Fulvivirgaceae bacterium BMA10]